RDNAGASMRNPGASQAWTTNRRQQRHKESALIAASWFCEIDDLDVEVWVMPAYCISKRKCLERRAEATQCGFCVLESGPLRHNQLWHSAAPQPSFRIITLNIADAAVRGEHRGGS